MVEDTNPNPDRERNDGGQYAPGSITTITESDVLAVMNETDDPVVTAGELADTLGANQQTIRRRLQSLYESGDVHRKEVGARAVVWWPTGSTS